MFFSAGSPVASFHAERKWFVIKGEMLVGVLGLHIGNISPTVYSFGFPNIKICLQSDTRSLIRQYQSHMACSLASDRSS